MASTRTSRRRGTRRVPRVEREGQMLAVARRAFSERGYDEVSVEEIARAVGVTKPMVYAYFGSKEGLYAACAARASDELSEAFRSVAAATELPPDERLWHGLLAYYDYVDRNRDAWDLLYATASPATVRYARESRRELAQLLAGLIAGVAEGEGVAPQAAEHVEMLAHSLVGAAIAGAEWWLEHPGEPRELAALRVMNLVWNGLGGLMRGELFLPPVEEEP